MSAFYSMRLESRQSAILSIPDIPITPNLGHSWPPLPLPIADIAKLATLFPMPAARPQAAPIAPLPLTGEEARFISETIRRFLGDDVVLRNFSGNPECIAIHVETDREVSMEKYDCLGVLMTRIDRPIGIMVTRRGTRVRGTAKLAYRQGIII